MTKMAIISALHAEAHCFSSKSNSSHLPVKEIISLVNCDLFISGIGAANSHSAAQTLVDNGAKALVSWGTAGALCQTLKPGDVIIPGVITEETGHSFTTSTEWRNQLIQQLAPKLPARSDKLFQSNAVITSVSQKQQLHQSSGAAAVDMESAAIAEVAEQHQLPMLAIRVIVDSANEVIPITATSGIDEFGRPKPLALIDELLKHPGDIPALFTLGKHFKQAQNSLQIITSITDQSLGLPSNLKK